MSAPGGAAARLLALRPALDELYASYNAGDTPEDPVHVIRPYTDAADREVVAFVASALAFGRVAGIMQSIARVLSRMGPRPAEFVRRFEPSCDSRAFDGFVHRWSCGTDVAALALILGHMLREAGSIEGFFAVGHEQSATDVTGALESFSTRALDAPVGDVRSPGVAYFFPRPSRGSACKRLNLFLRWMVRRDAVDPGGWTAVSPARLIVPLDTHVIRVGRCLRLTRYTSPGWRMAADITASLRAIDPADPVKYDFALCRLGMTGACGFSRPQKDARCPLRGACRPAPRKRRSSG